MTRNVSAGQSAGQVCIVERIRLGRDYGPTAAELRLIHFLPTHLSLQEIADRLQLSRPTRDRDRAFDFRSSWL